MKSIFKIALVFSFALHINNSNAQSLDRYTKEVIMIFKGISSRQIKLPVYLEINTHMLPSKLGSYQVYKTELNARKRSSQFKPSPIFNLTKQDCKDLNKKMLEDSTEITLKASWFSNNKIHVLDDSIINKQYTSGIKFIKPIFFRNDTRCFMVNFNETSLDAYFLKKVNGGWLFDQFYLRYEDD
jgi:hypothetical protein